MSDGKGSKKREKKREGEKMKKASMAAIGIIAVFACLLCLLLCTPALADYNFDGYPVETIESGTVNGGVFIDYEPWDGATTLTGNFNVPNEDIIWARLYTGIWGGRPGYAGWVNVTFNDDYNSNGLGPIHLQGEHDENTNVWCSGCGKHWIYYDVTDLVNAGVNTATVSKINATVDNFDGRVYGIVLVVVYDLWDGEGNPIQYWINDGSDGLNHVTQHNEGTTNFDGDVADADIVTDAELTMVHLTAYDPPCDTSCLKFNGNSLSTSMVNTNDFELNSWDVTDYVVSTGNNAWFSRGGDGYVSVCNAILTLEMVPPPEADLVISEIWKYWENCTICYKVTNVGDGTAPECHNTALYVDGVEVAHDHVPVDLAPGESYTGCFDGYEWGYTPPSDNITVCADNDETLVELDETNNCLTNIWIGMCGDVTGDGRVRTSDGRRIFHHITYGVPIDNMWAADVTGDGRVRTSDGRRIFHHITYGVPLNCKCSG